MANDISGQTAACLGDSYPGGAAVTQVKRPIFLVDFSGQFIREGAPVTFMFCGFESKTRVLRVYGHGRAVGPGTPEFEKVAEIVEHCSKPQENV